MKITTVKFETPKDKGSALKLAAYIQGQLDTYKGRKANMMKSKSDAEGKIKRLQQTLAALESQITAVNTNESNWQKQLRDLQTQFSLTEAEILETKSELLRKKISSLQKEAGVKPTGESTTV